MIDRENRGPRSSKRIRVITSGLLLTVFFAALAQPQNPPSALHDDELAQLNAVMRWYKNLNGRIEPGEQPSDTVYFDNARNLGPSGALGVSVGPGSSPLERFKQVPGTQYAWHEVVLALAPQADIAVLQTTLSAVVEEVHKEYEKASHARGGAYGDHAEIALSPPTPEQRLQFADTGLELIARFPVDLHKGPEMDDRITKGLMKAIRDDPKIASGIAGTPKIRAAVKG